MNRLLEIKERVAKYGLSRITKDEVAWWNARDELNFNAYDDLQYLLQDHTRLTAEIESLTAERDRFKAMVDAAEKERDATLMMWESRAQLVRNVVVEWLTENDPDFAERAKEATP